MLSTNAKGQRYVKLRVNLHHSSPRLPLYQAAAEDVALPFLWEVAL